MILHHYPPSPYSEKIRLMFGYAGLPWQSVICPPQPPRPSLDPLAGGYRRIPVAQLGADLFCDSRLICEEIAELTGRGELSALGAPADVRDFTAHVEDDIFMVAVTSIPPGRMLRQMFRIFSPWGVVKFIVDRAGMAKAASTPPPKHDDAVKLFTAHLQDLEARLRADFLFGSEPGIADFAAYHTAWFKTEIAGESLFEALPRVAAWYRRMGAIGHGECRELDAGEAFAVARKADPRPVPASARGHELVGKRVRISPDDYGRDAVAGTLVGGSDSRWILAREAPGIGLVHVHFPATGFSVEVAA